MKLISLLLVSLVSQFANATPTFYEIVNGPSSIFRYYVTDGNLKCESQDGSTYVPEVCAQAPKNTQFKEVKIDRRAWSACGITTTDKVVCWYHDGKNSLGEIKPGFKNPRELLISLRQSGCVRDDNGFHCWNEKEAKSQSRPGWKNISNVQLRDDHLFAIGNQRPLVIWGNNEAAPVVPQEWKTLGPVTDFSIADSSEKLVYCAVEYDRAICTRENGWFAMGIRSDLAIPIKKVAVGNTIACATGISGTKCWNHSLLTDVSHLDRLDLTDVKRLWIVDTYNPVVCADTANGTECWQSGGKLLSF